MKLNDICTPAYVCERSKLIKNLQTLKSIANECDIKILCALKGFAFSLGMDLVNEYLSGVCASGLYEAKFGRDFGFDEIHTYSVAFKDEEFDEINKISSHIVFNSINQFKKFSPLSDKSLGIRINPEISFSVCDDYNPCGEHSRFGVKLDELKSAFDKDKNLFDRIDGFHIHTLCEQGSKELNEVIKKFISDFGEFFKYLKWINLGGGHHITKKGYNKTLLIEILKNLKSQYPHLEIFLEPGEAVGWECGYLMAEILEILPNNIAIVDICAEAHMPDTIIMPYRPGVEGECDDGGFIYRFGGNSCLSGDIVGLKANEPYYKFNNKLSVGDRVKFLDQIHYTIVKNTTFNGIKLPSLVMVDDNNEILRMKEFGYSDYKNRN